MDQIEPPSTWPALFAKIVAERGNRDAIVMASETVSYAELDRRTAKMARALLALGAGKGTRIALMAPDGILFLTVYIACLRIGALLTLVSTLCVPPELAHIVSNSDTQIFIGVRRFLRHDYIKTLTAALPELTEGKAEKLRLRSAPYLRSVWLDDAEGLSWARSIEDLIAWADAPDAPDAALLSAIEQQVVPGDDAVIVYTSGSTSKPKAVTHTQWNVSRHAPVLADCFLLKPDDRMMPILPSFWLGGLAMAMEVLSIGATLVYPDAPDMETMLDAITRFRITRLNGWGDVQVRLAKVAAERGIDIDKIPGLGPIRDSQGELHPPGLQVNMLGMSETFASHSAERLDLRLDEKNAGSSGRAINGYERRVVDPETGEEVPLGQIGELQVRGGALMSGFYKVERRKVFTPDGFYPTNDLVRLEPDGHIYFIGRRGDMIKTKAANVSRLEVEAALRTLPEVEIPVVVGLPDTDLGERVVAAIVPAEGAAPTEESLKTALRGILSSFKIPREIVFITADDIPRTSTGKLKLSELANMVSSRLGNGKAG